MEEHIFLVRSNTFGDRAFSDRTKAINFILEQMYEMNMFGADKEVFSSEITDLFEYGFTDEFEIEEVMLNNFENYNEEINRLFSGEDEDEDTENMTVEYDQYPINIEE